MKGVIIFFVVSLCVYQAMAQEQQQQQTESFSGYRNFLGGFVGYTVQRMDDVFRGAGRAIAYTPALIADYTIGVLPITRSLYPLLRALWSFLQAILWVLYYPIVYPVNQLIYFIENLLAFLTIPV